MKIGVGKLLVAECRTNNVHVVRFKAPDVRPFLDDYVDMSESELFQELEEYILAHFAPGHGLVLNLAPIEMFNTAVLRFLLLVRKVVHDRKGCLVLCQVRDEHFEVFSVTRTFQLFYFAPSEDEAVRKIWMAPKSIAVAP